MLAFWVYLIAVVIIGWAIVRIIQTWKILLVLAIAGTCAYFIANYMFKNANMSDEHILAKTNQYLDTLDKWMFELDEYVDKETLKLLTDTPEEIARKEEQSRIYNEKWKSGTKKMEKRAMEEQAKYDRMAKSLNEDRGPDARKIPAYRR